MKGYCFYVEILGNPPFNEGLYYCHCRFKSYNAATRYVIQHFYGQPKDSFCCTIYKASFTKTDSSIVINSKELIEKIGSYNSYFQELIDVLGSYSNRLQDLQIKTSI